MHKKSIVHIMTKTRMKSDAFAAEIDAMEEISEKYGVKNVIYYKGEEIEYKDLVDKLAKFGILLYNYSNKEDLKEKIIKLNEEFEVIFIYTPLELLINIVNELRAAMGHALSDDPNIFRDKYLQRYLIQEYNAQLGIRFLKGTPEELDIDEIEKQIGYPCIIKPVDGVQSAGVAKIYGREDFQNYLDGYSGLHDMLKNNGIDNKALIVEEFIDGNLYSVDYFVSSDGGITMSKPVKVRLGIDIGVNDYCNIARICTQKTQSEFKGKKLKSFVSATVKATGIKNTFVHHEFKINSSGELKTIELNGRIGGGRLEVLKRAYDINLYEFLVQSDIKIGTLKRNNMAINIYATRKGILQSFNEKLLEKIRVRSTTYEVDIDVSAVGKPIGLTKDGFKKVGVIKFESDNYDDLRRDYLYVKGRYEDLLDIEEYSNGGGLMSKIKSLFS